MTEYTLQQKLIAEFIGTLFLTYTICLTAVWGSSGDFHPGFAIAAILMAMIYSLGYISGAHFNPAVTIGVWIRGSCEKAEVLPYIASQSIAGVFGALLSGYTYTGEYSRGSLETTSLLLNSEIHEVLLAEFLFTFALVYVILNVATSDATSGNQYYGVAIASVVFAGAISVGDVSMASFNPAVTISLITVGKLSIAQSWLHFTPHLFAGVLASLAFNKTNL
tara:strand:+ start:1169 stop:1831 length:663 start_codon:yes stop_codon:yes gene_type:complete